MKNGQPEMKMQQKRNSLSLLLTFFLLCLAACAPGRNDYSGFVNIDDSGWAYASPVTFNLHHEDSVAFGELKVAVRHTNSYPYSNLWLEVAYDDADGVLHKDTVGMELADVFGNWLGKGSGVQYQFETTVNGRLRHAAGHGVTVRHIMRADTLPDINLVGVTFLETR